MGGLNLLGQFSLAAGLCSFIAVPGQRIIFFIAAPCWMPAFAWAGRAFHLGIIDGWRIPVAVLTVVASAVLPKTNPKPPAPCMS